MKNRNGRLAGPACRLTVAIILAETRELVSGFRLRGNTLTPAFAAQEDPLREQLASR